MFTLMTLFAVLFAGAAIMAVIGLTVAAGKVVLYSIVWPLKLLLLPILLVLFVIKAVLIIAVVSIFAAVLIPLLIIGVLVAAPLFAVSALT
jgi:hypothetical protein